MKYIIDVPDDIYQIVLMDGIGQTRSFHRKIDLMPYTDIDTKELAEEFGRGYDAGWDAGNMFHEAEKESIQDEVWEFVKTLRNMRIKKFKGWLECFGMKTTLDVLNLDYAEAKSKYDAWLKQNDEINVGDEVTYTSCGDTVTFIVLGKKKNKYYGFIPNAPDYDDVGEYCDADMLKKTGRHFPEIVDLLEKVRGDEG